MSKSYLDKTGLAYFWSKIKDYIDSQGGSSYQSMSQSEADTGTATTDRVITAKVLNDKIITDSEYLDLARSLATTYSNTGTYFVGQFAIYSSNVYQCNTAITSGETWNSSHWTLLGTAS